MNEDNKIIAGEVLDSINKSARVLLHFHPSPDEDCVGSVLAMARFLVRQGKLVTIISGDSKTPKWIKYLPGGDSAVEQKFLETDLSQYDLFLALDTGSKKQITRFGDIVFPDSLRVVVIDHHARVEPFAQLAIVDDSYSATAELLFDLFKYWQVEIDHDMAICLFAGIYGDTGGFQYSKTTSRTFTTAAELVQLADDFAEVISNLRNNNSWPWVEFNALGVSLAESYGGGRLRLAPVPEALCHSRGIERENMENNLVAVTLRSVEGCEISASLIEGEGAVRISLRSRNGDRYDVSKIAEALGGGGHRAAAAAFLKMNLAEAKATLLAEIKNLFPDLLE